VYKLAKQSILIGQNLIMSRAGLLDTYHVIHEIESDHKVNEEEHRAGWI
jgi:hypothetical protein